MPLPTDLAEAHALILRQREELAAAAARASGAEALIAHMKLVIAKLRREPYGQSSKRGRKVLDQLELQLEELAAETSENAVTAGDKAAGVAVKSFARQRPVRAPLPAHLPRERVVIQAPCACAVCGGRLAKLGEDITETLEIVPRQWKVIQTVREKFTCRSCEKITQPPAPFHAIARARAGASLLAMILYAKFGQHQPLNRQSDVFAREGLELDVSTLADWVGACSATLAPLVELIRRHVLAADRIHGDDTTVPVLARNKTVTGRLWTYVRDDRPFGGSDPPAAMFFYSRDRGGEHPRRHLSGWAGILQADAYAGFGELYEARRSPRPIGEAACWVHSRRKFFVLADLKQALLAAEAVCRIDEIFAIEREVNGAPPAQRHAVRQERIKPLVAALEGWMRTERARLSRHADTAKAIDYMLKRWAGFTRFLDDGRICLTNNAAERALRGIAIGRRAWLFAGSDRGGERAAAMFTLIETAKLNDIDPQAWLAEVLRRINDHPAARLAELLPWNWPKPSISAAAWKSRLRFLGEKNWIPKLSSLNPGRRARKLTELSMATRLEILERWHLLRPYLDRRQQILWAATEAEVFGYGGRALLHNLTGISVSAISARMRDIRHTKAAMAGSLAHEPPYARGRKFVEVVDPNMEAALERMLSDEIAGDPMSNQKWVRSSLRRLSKALEEEGHQACTHTVARLLRKSGYSLQVNKKKQAGAKHPDRDQQFRYITSQKAQLLGEGIPVISVDPKKKELIGNYRREGQTWCREPIAVDAHFASYAQCIAVPFGVYDLARNAGYVTVGTSHNTAEFAVNCLVNWWEFHGRLAYPRGDRLLILADGGGGNGYNLRVWKRDLQERLCDRFGINVTVSHYPPGCSKWNPVEYRLFSHISINWAGRPLRSLETMLGFIRGTTTTAGLKVDAHRDDRIYPKGRKVTQKEMRQLALQSHEICPRWNYTLNPRLIH